MIKVSRDDFFKIVNHFGLDVILSAEVLPDKKGMKSKWSYRNMDLFAITYQYFLYGPDVTEDQTNEYYIKETEYNKYKGILK